MSKKDYELIARAIRERRSPGDSLAVVESIADALQADNPRFDRVRFLKACGVSE